MGQLDSTCRAPPWGSVTKLNLKANFETRFSLQRFSRVETRRFQAVGSSGFNLYTAPTVFCPARFSSRAHSRRCDARSCADDDEEEDEYALLFAA
jgi:hypothetical protein